MPLRVLLMCLSFSIITGATFNLAKYSVSYFSAASAAGWRFGMAAVAMVIILLLTEKFNKDTVKQNGMMYWLLGIIGVFGFNALFFLGMKSTAPVNGSLIMATNPLVTTILAIFFLKAAVTSRQWVGITFSLLGVILVITQGSWALISNLAFSIGDIFVLLGNICWALYTVLGRRYLKNSSPMATTSYTMVTGSLFLILVAAFSPSPVALPDIPLSAWGAIAFMAFFTSVIGYLMWNKAVAEVGAAKTAIFFNLVPVVTMIISVLTGSTLTWFQMAGAALVIVGVMIFTGILKFGSTVAPTAPAKNG